MGPKVASPSTLVFSGEGLCPPLFVTGKVPHEFSMGTGVVLPLDTPLTPDPINSLIGHVFMIRLISFLG